MPIRTSPVDETLNADKVNDMKIMYLFAGRGASMFLCVLVFSQPL